MDLGLKGKKAIVTGGSKGIGRRCAEGLAAEGADVAICARNADEVKAAVKSLSAKGVKAFGSAIDVGDAATLKNWVASAAKDLGGIDIVISNVSALAINADEDSWQKEFNVDMMGTVRVIETAMPWLE